MVKPYVVGHQYRAIKQRCQLAGYLGKTGCMGHHGIVDAGELFNKARNGCPGVDQGAPARDLHALFHPHGRNFGDAVLLRTAARGFQIQQHIAGQHRGLKMLQKEELLALD